MIPPGPPLFPIFTQLVSDEDFQHDHGPARRDFGSSPLPLVRCRASNHHSMTLRVHPKTERDFKISRDQPFPRGERIGSIEVGVDDRAGDESINDCNAKAHSSTNPRTARVSPLPGTLPGEERAGTRPDSRPSHRPGPSRWRASAPLPFAVPQRGRDSRGTPGAASDAPRRASRPGASGSVAERGGPAYQAVQRTADNGDDDRSPEGGPETVDVER